MWPFEIPYLSLINLRTGTIALVVQEAAEIILSLSVKAESHSRQKRYF